MDLDLNPSSALSLIMWPSASVESFCFLSFGFFINTVYLKLYSLQGHSEDWKEVI